MEIEKLHDYKYIINDSDKIFSIVLSRDKKYYRCNCSEFQQKNNCNHIQALLEFLGVKKVSIKKVNDPYIWLKFYENQIIEKLGIKSGSYNRD